MAFSGKRVSQVLEGQVPIDMVLRYDDEARRDLDAVGNTLTSTPLGPKVPLRTLAALREDRGPNYVGREAVQRRIVVSRNVVEKSLVDVVNEVQQRVAQAVQFPRYRVEDGGQCESAASASRILVVLGVAVFIMIFGLLIVAFHATADAAVVMLNLPLALSGGVAGVYAGGGVLSIAGVIGFITLFGIAARNGILLLSHIRHLKEHRFRRF